MIIQGDGSWQARLEQGICPKCDCQTLERVEGADHCKTCKLTILRSPEKPDENSESADADDQRYAQCDNL